MKVPKNSPVLNIKIRMYQCTRLCKKKKKKAIGKTNGIVYIYIYICKCLQCVLRNLGNMPYRIEHALFSQTDLHLILD